LVRTLVGVICFVAATLVPAFRADAVVLERSTGIFNGYELAAGSGVDRVTHAGGSCARYKNGNGTLLGYVCANASGRSSTVEQVPRSATDTDFYYRLDARAYNSQYVARQDVAYEFQCHKNTSDHVVNDFMISHSFRVDGTSAGRIAGSEGWIGEDSDHEHCNVVRLVVRVTFTGRSGSQYSFVNAFDYERYGYPALPTP
jgi:hypothetical protein